MEAAPQLPAAKVVVSAQAFLVTMQRINEMEARHTAQMKRLRQAWTHVVDAHQRRGDAETAVAQAQHQHRLAVEMENLLQTDFISATEDLEQRRETSKACQAGIVRRIVQATFAGGVSSGGCCAARRVFGGKHREALGCPLRGGPLTGPACQGPPHRATELAEGALPQPAPIACHHGLQRLAAWTIARAQCEVMQYVRSRRRCSLDALCDARCREQSGV